jgi:hypothetical protein
MADHVEPQKFARAFRDEVSPLYHHGHVAPGVDPHAAHTFFGTDQFSAVFVVTAIVCLVLIAWNVFDLCRRVVRFDARKLQ